MDILKKLANYLNKEIFLLILIPTISYFGFSSSYYFEKGYLSFFNLPSGYIELSIETIIPSVTILFKLFLGIFSLLAILYFESVTTSKLKPLDTKLSKVIVGIYIIIFLTDLLQYKYFQEIASVLFIILIFSGLLGIVIFFLTKSSSTEQAKKRDLKEVISNHKNVLFDFLLSPSIFLFIFLLLILNVINNIAFNAGVAVAKEQKSFQVYNYNSTNYAVIRKYKNSYISLAIDTKEKKLINKVLVKSTLENTPLVYIRIDGIEMYQYEQDLVITTFFN